MKRFVSVVLSYILLFSVTTSASAATISPRWNNIAAIIPVISSSDGYYSCDITGNVGTTRIDCTMTLNEKSGVNTYAKLDSITGTYYGRGHTFVGYYPISTGKTYQIIAEITVVTNGVSETITYTYEKAC